MWHARPVAIRRVPAIDVPTIALTFDACSTRGPVELDERIEA